MTELEHALRGAQHTGAALASGAGAAPRRLLVLGGAGALGSAVLHQLLGSGGFAQLAALVQRPLDVSLRGFEAWQVTDPHAPFSPPWLPDTAVLVFDQPRLYHRREAAFLMPQPDQLAAWGRWLVAAGVRRLLVLQPLATAVLPQALRQGLASLDEQALATLGFEQLVLIRPARAGGSASTASVPAGGLHRLARGLLAQLQWMTPQREQPLRVAKVAQFVADLTQALPEMAAGTRVVAPELLWDWARPGAGPAVLQAWLAGQTLPAVALPARRW